MARICNISNVLPAVSQGINTLPLFLNVSKVVAIRPLGSSLLVSFFFLDMAVIAVDCPPVFIFCCQFSIFDFTAVNWDDVQASIMSKDGVEGSSSILQPFKTISFFMLISTAYRISVEPCLIRHIAPPIVRPDG